MNKICCFVGYRPQQCQLEANDLDPRSLLLKENMRIEIKKAIIEGYDCFLCGMSLDFDLLCAKIVFELKEQFPNIRLCCVLPCKDASKYLDNRIVEQFRAILKYSDDYIYLNKAYDYNWLEQTSRFLVDNSSLVITCFDGHASLAKATMEYAIRKRKRVNFYHLLDEE